MPAKLVRQETEEGIPHDFSDSVNRLNQTLQMLLLTDQVEPCYCIGLIVTLVICPAIARLCRSKLIRLSYKSFRGVKSTFELDESSCLVIVVDVKIIARILQDFPFGLLVNVGQG